MILDSCRDIVLIICGCQWNLQVLSLESTYGEASALLHAIHSAEEISAGQVPPKRTTVVRFEEEKGEPSIEGNNPTVELLFTPDQSLSLIREDDASMDYTTTPLQELSGEFVLDSRDSCAFSSAFSGAGYGTDAGGALTILSPQLIYGDGTSSSPKSPRREPSNTSVQQTSTAPLEPVVKGHPNEAQIRFSAKPYIPTVIPVVQVNYYCNKLLPTIT